MKTNFVKRKQRVVQKMLISFKPILAEYSLINHIAKFECHRAAQSQPSVIIWRFSWYRGHEQLVKLQVKIMTLLIHLEAIHYITGYCHFQHSHPSVTGGRGGGGVGQCNLLFRISWTTVENVRVFPEEHKARLNHFYETRFMDWNTLLMPRGDIGG